MSSVTLKTLTKIHTYDCNFIPKQDQHFLIGLYRGKIMQERLVENSFNGTLPYTN